MVVILCPCCLDKDVKIINSVSKVADARGQCDYCQITFKLAEAKIIHEA